MAGSATRPNCGRAGGFGLLAGVPAGVLGGVAAGALGGVVGHQFGNGKGQTAMTAAGAVAGAGVSRHRQSQQQAVQQLELTIKMQSGQLIQVVQQVDGSLTFSQGDKVRVLTSGSNTRVDKSV